MIEQIRSSKSSVECRCAISTRTRKMGKQKGHSDVLRTIRVIVTLANDARTETPMSYAKWQRREKKKKKENERRSYIESAGDTKVSIRAEQGIMLVKNRAGIDIHVDRYTA